MSSGHGVLASSCLFKQYSRLLPQTTCLGWARSSSACNHDMRVLTRTVTSHRSPLFRITTRGGSSFGSIRPACRSSRAKADGSDVERCSLDSRHLDAPEEGDPPSLLTDERGDISSKVHYTSSTAVLQKLEDRDPLMRPMREARTCMKLHPPKNNASCRFLRALRLLDKAKLSITVNLSLPGLCLYGRTSSG